MKTVKAAEAKARFAELLDGAGYRGERVLVEKRKRPVAVIIGYEDYKKLEKLEDLFESRLLERVLKERKFYSLEEVSRRLKIAL